MELKLLKQRIDYEKIVSGKDLDYETHKKKFLMWDYVVEKRLDIVGVPEALNLLHDPVIYAYAFFRDDKGNPLKLTAYQDAIMNCLHDMTPENPNRFMVWKASNQIGKSWALVSLAVFHAMTEENINIVMVSKSLPQSQFLLAQLRFFLNNSVVGEKWRDEVGETANTTHLTFVRNGGRALNRIICAPCGEGLLGYPVHYLYLDEADFYENSKIFFWKVALPRTNTTKGQIILFSNPNAEISRDASLLWEAWTGGFFQRKFSFRFLDCPWNTRKEYDAAKKASPSYIFASTHDGEFPEDQGGFFTRKEVDDMLKYEWNNQIPIVDRPVFIGLDLAKMKDRTVLSLGTMSKNKDDESLSNLDVRYLKEFLVKTDYDQVITELKRLVDHYKSQHGVGGIGIDVSGVGRAVSDFAKAQGIKVFDVKFSLENKSRKYGNFKILAEQRRIRIVGVDNCREQLMNLVFKTTPSGYLSIHHAKEVLKDDYPDSLCALIDVSVCPSKIPVSATFVDRKQEESIVRMDDPGIMSYHEYREKAIKKQVLENRPDYLNPMQQELGRYREW